MTRFPSILVACVVVPLAIASCSSHAPRARYLTSRGPAGEVTGFTSFGFSPYGPVTVRITQSQAHGLALLVGQLSPIAQSQVDCHEPLGLMYRIVFDAGSVARRREVVDGYRCDAGVRVTLAGEPSSWLRDANCALIRAVRRVLPGRAKATRNLTIGCASH